MPSDTFIFTGQYNVHRNENIAVLIEFTDKICLESCRLTLCAKGSVIASHYEGVIKEAILLGELRMSYGGSQCGCCGGDNFSNRTEKDQFYPSQKFQKFVEEASNRRHFWYYEIIPRVVKNLDLIG